ncbi:MAG: CBS domain-containing protein [Bacillota bacterium]
MSDVNVAFFLTPKSEVVCIPLDSTMREALEKMEYHQYTAVPLIDDSGCYVGVLTEGDLLWEIKRRDVFCVRDLEKIPLSEVRRNVRHQAVSIHEDVQSLLSLALDQNFVPVVDDKGVFIGIVTRKTVIEFFAAEYLKKHPLKGRSTALHGGDD